MRSRAGDERDRRGGESSYGRGRTRSHRPGNVADLIGAIHALAADVPRAAGKAARASRRPADSTRGAWRENLPPLYEDAASARQSWFTDEQHGFAASGPRGRPLRGRSRASRTPEMPGIVCHQPDCTAGDSVPAGDPGIPAASRFSPSASASPPFPGGSCIQQRPPAPPCVTHGSRRSWGCSPSCCPARIPLR